MLLLPHKNVSENAEGGKEVVVCGGRQNAEGDLLSPAVDAPCPKEIPRPRPPRLRAFVRVGWANGNG